MTLKNYAVIGRCKGKRSRGCVSNIKYICLYRLSLNDFKDLCRDSQIYGRSEDRMCINIRPICLNRLTLNGFKLNAGTARCKGDQIRGYVSIIAVFVCVDLGLMTEYDAEKARCEGNRFRGYISIKYLFVGIKLLWSTLRMMQR